MTTTEDVARVIGAIDGEVRRLRATVERLRALALEATDIRQPEAVRQRALQALADAAVRA